MAIIAPGSVFKRLRAQSSIAGPRGRGRFAPLYPEEPDEHQREQRGQSRRRDHVAGPMIVHADSRDRDEHRNDQERQPVTRKEKQQRKKQAPKMGGMPGRKRRALIAKKFPIPVPGLNYFKRAQAMENVFQSAGHQASNEMSGPDEQQNPGG